MTDLINPLDLEFNLYDVLDTEALIARPRYAELSREIFDATIDTARRIGEDVLAPHYSKGDAHEPSFDGTRVTLIPETQAAWDSIAQAGFLNAHWDESEGGSQLPDTVLKVATTWFNAANVASAGYSWLTVGAANLLRSFGSETLKAKFLTAMGDGRFAGTMALTEPGQGSALGDITTRAVPQADGSYRLFGSKMFISGGDQSLTRNIIHMVLARTQGAPAGVKGISLFLVPKVLVNDDGTLGARNDVALAGLLHKMGWRNTTSTILSFGEKDGAVGYLLGESGKGLAHMFQMMNEARINVGLCAAALAYRAYLLTLDYARERPQGRLPSCKDALSPQVKLIDHADVRRMLLAQKAYAEGSLALCLYASSLYEDQHTHPDATAREQAALLLDILTPIVKSWPSRYGLKANELAIQVLGGSGYIREHLQEQLYRDQRLNPIHEGAEAIHALDLLGRKVVMQNGAAYKLFRQRVAATQSAAAAIPTLAPLAQLLDAPLMRLDVITVQIAQLLTSNPDLALANANLYLDAFGRITLSWIWLTQALVAQRALDAKRRPTSTDFYTGKIHTAQYYLRWELPQTSAQFDLLGALDDTTLAMQDGWF
jgi:alkylation response protein AidB-like acyl-CoA dehydrogenase